MKIKKESTLQDKRTKTKKVVYKIKLSLTQEAVYTIKLAPMKEVVYKMELTQTKTEVCKMELAPRNKQVYKMKINIQFTSNRIGHSHMFIDKLYNQPTYFLNKSSSVLPSAIPPALFLVYLGAVVVVDVVEGVVILALNCSATTTADWLFSMRSAE